ncbi:maestro heat-like repeat family member 5 [Hippopotamus amphibius kiboko]|uniref:maestro heat-like repeat family member 5 n=1 Tax=Hippopotamus amphibius kiboko TaxID=575201 RepID=UPI0025979873|nr:maestro heat-like repeat family member 5 [Hippopotamus amphibius kiboko]
MDRQHSEKPPSHATADGTSSASSQKPRISSHISESTKYQSYMKVPRNSARRDRQTHPTTILLCKSRSSQAALVPKEHKTFMEEAYNAAICFKMLRDLNGSDPVRLKHIIKKIKNMAHRAPNLVLETIHDYFVDNLEIPARHKFRLFHVLQAVIGASESLEETWEKTFIQLALENMTKSTELEEAYQDAASHVLVAICRHAWRVVAQHLETEVLSGTFPHRSLLHVMGILTSNEELFKEGEKACWEEQLAKMAVKSVQFLNTEGWSKELLGALTKPDQTHQEQPLEKAFLFIYYGLILQAEENGTTVRTHLRALLETSHQWPKQREGIALTVGLAAARHLDHVWAVLEQFGRSTPIKWSLNSFSPKNAEDLRWKWASSTILLAYGQMAAKAKVHILPWVDNILSRMIFFFHYSSWDETLKQSFLKAILMLVRAISRNEGAHSYEFSQVSELLECLMLLIEKEPQDTLCTSTRQQAIHIISSLCKLRPPLDVEKKSRLLSISLRSVLSLPLLEVLEKHTCLFLEPPNIQVQPWRLPRFEQGRSGRRLAALRGDDCHCGSRHQGRCSPLRPRTRLAPGAMAKGREPLFTEHLLCARPSVCIRSPSQQRPDLRFRPPPQAEFRRALEGSAAWVGYQRRTSQLAPPGSAAGSQALGWGLLFIRIPCPPPPWQGAGSSPVLSCPAGMVGGPSWAWRELAGVQPSPGSAQDTGTTALSGRRTQPSLRPAGAWPPPDLLHVPAQSLYNKTSEALDQMLQSLLVQNPTADELHFLLSHLYFWLASEKAHERQRAAHSCVTLLKFLSHNPHLDPREDFRRIGELVGMLGILCQDPDEATQSRSLEGVGHLYKLLMRRRGEALQVQAPSAKQLSKAGEDGAPLWSDGDQEATAPSPQEVVLSKDHVFQPGSSPGIKEIAKHLTMAELTDLIRTAVDGLGSISPFRVQAAADLLLSVVREHGAKLKTVANLGRAIHLQLCSVRIPQAKGKALQAITLLARNHTPELVAAFLDFSIPLNSHALRLWRALGAERPVSRLVLSALLAWLRKRPLPTRTAAGSPRPEEEAYLRSVAAMNTLHELQFAREFKKAMQESYPELFLALLTQMHYILELNLPKESQPGKEAQEVAVPSPQSCRTALEALRSLLSTTGHWRDFAHLELQRAWDLFTTIHTYPQGVGLLARAMVQNGCGQVKALIVQLLPRLQSQEERERKAAILLLTEFLYSPTLLEVLPRQAALTVLARSLRDPSPEICVLSLQGLGNILFHPEKGSLLRGQLPPLLDGFFQSSEPVVVRLMRTVSDVLHRLGPHGTEAQSLGIAINARSFFDDQRDAIRAAAVALFGELAAAMAGRRLSGLRTQVRQSMVALLLHLKDSCPAVVTQAKFAFYHCSVLLRWRPRHTLFCTLAWEKGLSARHFLWSCLISHSQEELSLHWAQALSYLHSRHHYIKTWAALFIGYTICYHPQAVSQMVNDVDMKLLFCTFEDLKNDPEPGIREFATRQSSFLQKVAARPQ